MNIEFYFDPSCPFCWITSRWLLMVSADRDITIRWQPFSLAIKNDELGNDGESMHGGAHRVLRVMMAATQKTDASLIDLYTAFGIKHHVAGFEFDDELIKDVLEESSLPAELAGAADDTTHDAALTSTIADATAIAGDDIGVPTIVFTNQADDKQGFFGPVLQTLPDTSEALELWDGLSKLATNTSFYELKRSRPDGGPDVFSTAKC